MLVCKYERAAWRCVRSERADVGGVKAKTQLRGVLAATAAVLGAPADEALPLLDAHPVACDYKMKDRHGTRIVRGGSFGGTPSFSSLPPERKEQEEVNKAAQYTTPLKTCIPTRRYNQYRFAQRTPRRRAERKRENERERERKRE